MVRILHVCSSGGSKGGARSFLLLRISLLLYGIGFFEFLPPAIRRMTEGYIFSLSTFRGGGVPGPSLRSGGVPGLRFWGGRGPRSQIFGGGVPGLRFLGGTRSQIFTGGGYPVSVKGKIFDTRFGLIHVQTGKKNFCQGTPPHPRIARNCYGYVAGGMPLAFTQEDFLV